MRPVLHSPNSRSSAAATAAMTLTAVAGTVPAVDNLLAAATVRDRLAAGAKPLRIECDFVTCSQ